MKNKIIFFIKTFDNPFYSSFAHHLGKNARERGYLVSYYFTQNDPEFTNDMYETLLEDPSNIFFTNLMSAADIRPFINNFGDRFICFFPETLEADYKNKTLFIYTDRFSGGYTATCHLLDRRMKNIAFIGDLADPRCHGYKKALLDRNIDINDDLLLGLDTDIDKVSSKERGTIVYERLQKSFKHKPEPDSFFCISDDIAVHTILNLYRMKKHIPNDISVCGFDGAYNTITASLRLTSVAHDYVSLFNTAIDLMEKNKISDHDIIPVKPFLIEGETVSH